MTQAAEQHQFNRLMQGAASKAIDRVRANTREDYAEAQVWATLAVANELAGLRDALERLIVLAQES